MQKCGTCGGTEFFKDTGYLYCQTCYTRNEDVQEQIFELRRDPTTRFRKTRVKVPRSKRPGGRGLTSWELYNYALIGMTNELIGLGVLSDIKLTVLQLWATYLQKLEVAFTSTKQKCIPKLSRRYYKKSVCYVFIMKKQGCSTYDILRDADILYGEAEQGHCKKKRNGSTFSITSQCTNENSSSRALSRSKKLMMTAEYNRYLQCQSSSEGDQVSSHNQTVHSDHSDVTKSADSTRQLRFNSYAYREKKKIRNMSKKLPRNKRVRYQRAHLTTQYKLSPQLITPMRLWSIIYIALRIHDQQIHLGDMLRYKREGHLSYHKLDHLIPSNITLLQNDRKLLSHNSKITNKGMRRMIATMAKFLGVWKVTCPDLLDLIARYCQELQLPNEIFQYAEKLLALSPPKMVFNRKSPYIPNYEGRAMAYIIVVLKTLFALDGVTEYYLSTVAEYINSLTKKEELFSFREWQRYIECRKTILKNFHFPTKLKTKAHAPTVSGLYIQFLEYLHSKRNNEITDTTSVKHSMPKELRSSMKQCIANLYHEKFLNKELIAFAPSTTPLHSYMQELLENPIHCLPSILKTDFVSKNVSFTSVPDSLRTISMQYDVKLEFVESNMHFVEKVVPPFQPTKMSNLTELNSTTDIEKDRNSKEMKCNFEYEDLSTYLHKKIPCELNLNRTKRQYYDNMQTFRKQFREQELQDDDSDFDFTSVLPSGKLNIGDDDSDCENGLDSLENRVAESSSIASKLLKDYNLQLSHSEKESVFTSETDSSKKKATKHSRDLKGKFISTKRFEKLKDAGRRNQPQNDSETGSSDMTETKNFNFPNVETKKNLNQDTKNCTFAVDNSIASSDIDGGYTSTKISNSTDAYCCKQIRKQTLQIFHPFREYWMYHCIFSHVKPKNFKLFQKELPISFRWLLSECANVIETSVEDLYEEVCLIENYYTRVFKFVESEADCSSHDTDFYRKIILSRW